VIALLHNIANGPGSNYDSRRKVEAWLKHNPEGILTFDGIYENVYYNRDLLRGREVILFIIGDVVGGDNAFDKGQPRETYCSWDQLHELAKDGAELAWHTWSHRDLTKLSDKDVLMEITPPDWLECTKFAYPYGIFDERVVGLVSERYESAYTAGRGDGSRYQIRRQHIR